MSGKDRPAVGQIFYAPLYEGGYAFGYVSLIDKTTITLCSFFDLVSETPEPPTGLVDLPLVLEDLPVGGAEFMQRKRYPELRWIAIDQHMPGEVKATHTRYIMRSRPDFQLVDLADKSSKRVATEQEIARYPDLSVPFSPFTTRQVEKAVRHLDIDEELIGVDRAAGTVH
ncbi:hypothetical protein QLH51_08005 [Sphingomonas sp. 2R-10]|uniref:hypothetical protein n=1 Tax=Sphingomonas sp. 2R-10 TaxID=3045148 RepID=UPI0024B8E680|nr:hypothetical protein [Sphingomonas sp. 2R-10]MDJ0276735.1 hypothetical protein [Sphingomonas sp. 2R-10]